MFSLGKYEVLTTQTSEHYCKNSLTVFSRGQCKQIRTLFNFRSQILQACVKTPHHAPIPSLYPPHQPIPLARMFLKCGTVYFYLYFLYKIIKSQIVCMMNGKKQLETNNQKEYLELVFLFFAPTANLQMTVRKKVNVSSACC